VYSTEEGIIFKNLDMPNQISKLENINVYSQSYQEGYLSWRSIPFHLDSDYVVYVANDTEITVYLFDDMNFKVLSRNQLYLKEENPTNDNYVRLYNINSHLIF